ncbi:universal stress protein [Halostella sp. JP-L12]|uniref:universal stress protein n=1 Tax=Halostella TaxID=1843185 RepID=UPI000EF7AEFD|nr:MULTISPECIES: universal stress protein [Halostella]NHN48061.1 universal stress protein [Halostella sp. JP-L12]
MCIVVPVSRSNSADSSLEEGYRLAEKFDEELHVLHVLSRNDFHELNQTSVERKHISVQMEEIERTAAEIASEIADHVPIDVTAVGRVGDPADKIVQYGREQNTRYIVMGAKKRSPVGKTIFGSVAQSVLLNADQPVIVVSE